MEFAILIKIILLNSWSDLHDMLKLRLSEVKDWFNIKNHCKRCSISQLYSAKKKKIIRKWKRIAYILFYLQITVIIHYNLILMIINVIITILTIYL